MKKIIFFMALAFNPTLLLGQVIETPKDFGAGVHLLAQHIDKIQVDDQGNTNGIDPSLFLSLQARWDFKLFNKNFRYDPMIGFGLPRSERDENISRFEYFILSPVALSLNDRFSIHFGPGLFMTRLSGEGGTVELDNGTGSDFFFLPEETKTSYNTIWDLGAQFWITKNISARGDVIVFNLLDSASRTFSLAASVHFFFGAQSP